MTDTAPVVTTRAERDAQRLLPAPAPAPHPVQVYAPTTITHHHHPAPVTQDDPARPSPTPAPPPWPQTATRRRYTLPELCFYLGMAITGSSAAAVALSVAAGDPTLLLGAPAVVGTAVIVGSGVAINHQERAR